MTIDIFPNEFQKSDYNNNLAAAFESIDGS